jgi:hypothetical protein
MLARIVNGVVAEYPYSAVQLRAAWPQNLPMSVRISAHDWVEGGITPDDAVAGRSLAAAASAAPTIPFAPAATAAATAVAAVVDLGAMAAPARRAASSCWSLPDGSLGCCCARTDRRSNRRWFG